MLLSTRLILSIATLSMASIMAPPSARAQAPKGFGVCVPRSQRIGRALGCFIVTERVIGPADSLPLYWHVTQFASREQADAVRPPKGSVFEAFGKAWLMTLGAADMYPGAGTQVAAIGPLPVTPGVTYSAMYMEASMQPGMKSAVHRHSGPEAWHTLSGETYLETPLGTQVGRANGPPVIVSGGQPMELTATGTALRRSLVLILHPAPEPPTTPDTTWVPKGLCRK